MKTSKYILISFFVFIFASIFVLYADAKSHKKQKAKIFVSENSLQDFHTIVAEENSNIEILNDSVNTISTELKTETPYNFTNFKINNDTLFISKSADDLHFTIKGKSIKVVHGKKDSRIRFTNFYSDSLSINFDGAYALGSLNNKKISRITIEAKNSSQLYLGCPNELILNAVKIEADNSRISIHTNNIKALKANLKNGANLQTGKSEKLKIEADKTSNYTIMKYRFTTINPRG